MARIPPAPPPPPPAPPTAHELAIRDLQEASRRERARQEAGWRMRKLSICHRRLTDEVSIARAVGPVCWGHVLNETGHSGPLASAATAIQGELHL